MADDQQEHRQMQKQFTANVPAPSALNVSNSSALAHNWKKFRRQWENYAIASRLRREDNEFQSAVFLATIGEEAMDIFDGLKFNNEADRKNLQIIIQKFEEFCVGKSNEAYESYKFHSRKQEEGEPIETYIATLRSLAKNCNFGQLEDRLIRDQVVMGIREDSLREKLLEKRDLTLDDCLEVGRSHETSKQQLQSMSGADTPQVSRVQASRGRNRKKSYHQAVKHASKKDETKCGRCGKFPSHPRKECPAREAECKKCHIKGHYALMCRTKRDIVRQVEEEDFILGTITMESDEKQTSHSVATVYDDPWHAQITVNGKGINFKIDTGADVSVVPDRYFKENSPLIKPTNKKLFGAGQKKIDVVGQCSVTLSTEKTTTTQDLFVVKDLKEPLLGRPAIEALQLLQRINTIRLNDQSAKNIQKEFPQLFQGLGKMQSVYKIRLKDQSAPFSIAAPRRLPLPMKDKVEEELKKMVQDDIIRSVTTPTDWCAPIVVVPKANGKVRICIDFTKLNENVRREYFPLPTTEQLLAQLSGATKFSKLDCNSGFYQIPLEEESQLLTTFITPFGRFCFKRLPFGINSGPEIFHREMTHILAGIPGVICDIDDVLISGKSQKEHDDRLRTVLLRMKEAGVTLNDKCVFSTDQIKFLGHIISPEGIRIDPDKVAAITNFPRPTNVSELRRLLGMVNHIAKFAPNLADTTKPLRDLLKKESEWIWEQPQETVFQTLKQQLSSAPVLQHYDPQRETKVSTDASSYGLGGVLLQKDGDNWKPIFYASRSLSATEQRYAQVEKEALAVTWCCEKFSDFLVGLKCFTIETDHKPLLALLKTKHLDELTPRIQRFRMRMMRFSYQIEYTSGKNLMTADTLSRAPGGVPAEQDRQMEVEDKMFVCSVMRCLPVTDRRLEEIRLKQESDKICSQIINFCKMDHWPEQAKSDPLLKPYWTVRHDLTVQQGLLLFQTRLVIPQALYEEMLTRIHEGHQGIVKCRALARTCIWWPGLSKQLEKKVGDCPICEKERVLPVEPLKPTKTPDYPWQQVGMDLFEFKGHQYLLVVDYFSRWIELAYLNHTTSSTVIKHCKSIFSRQGIPEIVISDNGPQFSSRDFVTFSQDYGFTHLTSSPLYPQGNGEAERAVRTLKNLLKKSEDPYIALLNYRTTPLQHGSSPGQLLMGRKLRNKVPACSIQYVPHPPDLTLFKETDTSFKNKQKIYYDRRHRAKTLPDIPDGQHIWVKTPKDTKAQVVTSKPKSRTYIVETPTGRHRRNRRHLRLRGRDSLSEFNNTPTTSSILPDQPGILASSDQQSDQHPDVSANTPEEKSSDPTTSATSSALRTRSGRLVKAPIRLDI